MVAVSESEVYLL